MKKFILYLSLGLGLFGGSFLFSVAAECPTANTFPTSLNTFATLQCIPRQWANALEVKMGITGSAVTSTLDYQINHLFTSYGSEIIKATSTQGLLQTANNLSDLVSSSSARANLIQAGNKITISATGTIGLTTSSISQFTNDSGYAAVAGSQTNIQFNDGGSFAATTTFTFTSSTQQLLVGNVLLKNSLTFSTSTYFQSQLITSTVYTANTTSSITAPASANWMTVSLTGAGGGGASAGGAGMTGGGHGWLGNSSSSPLATSTLIAICGGGSGGASNTNGAGAGQGLNTSPDTYGGAATAANGGSNPGSCFTASNSISTSTGTVANGGSGGIASGGNGGATTSTFPTASGTVYWYNLGVGGVGGGGGGTGSTSTLTINWYTGYPTNDFGTAIGGHIITGGIIPTVSSCGGGASVAGNDTVGSITTGSSTTACTLSFAQLWQFAPVCTANVASGTAVAFKAQAVTTSTVFTAASAMATSSKISYMCLGY